MDTVGIIGQGFVGNAIFQKFKNYFKVLTFDKNLKKCNSSINEISKKCKIIFLCLPTPMNNDGSCDVSIVKSVLDSISQFDNEYIIVLKSTVAPTTTERFNNIYSNLSIVFNPEFLTERNAVEDFNNQDRVILGGPRPATTILKQLYSKIFPKAHIIKTGSTHAEMVKYFTNCFLATKVSFANEMYQISNKLNLDYDKIIEYSILDKRIGNSHLSVPGPDGDFGFGGHCFPKDMMAIINLSKKLKLDSNVLNSVIKTNDKLRRNRDWELMIGRAINK